MTMLLAFLCYAGITTTITKVFLGTTSETVTNKHYVNM